MLKRHLSFVLGGFSRLPLRPASARRKTIPIPSDAAGTTPASSCSQHSPTLSASGKFPTIQRARAMTARANPSRPALTAHSMSESGRLVALAAYLAACGDTCADYYAAAALYEKLSALSDAELHRRGLSRATLARYVCSACDRNTSR